MFPVETYLHILPYIISERNLVRDLSIKPILSKTKQQHTWTVAAICCSHSFPQVLLTHTEQEMQLRPPQSSLKESVSESKEAHKHKKSL